MKSHWISIFINHLDCKMSKDFETTPHGKVMFGGGAGHIHFCSISPTRLHAFFYRRVLVLGSELFESHLSKIPTLSFCHAIWVFPSQFANESASASQHLQISPLFPPPHLIFRDLVFFGFGFPGFMKRGRLWIFFFLSGSWKGRSVLCRLDSAQCRSVPERKPFLEGLWVC